MDRKKQIYYLSELSDYKIKSGYPDVRGWDVKDFDNRVIGKVDNLLVNKESERVVYLDVEVDDTIISANHDPYGRPANIEVREFINSEGENHIIIPIGLADINEEPDYIYTSSIDHRTFAETKRIRKGVPIDRDYEVVVIDSYRRRKNIADLSKKDRQGNERRMDRDQERLEKIKRREHMGEYRDEYKKDGDEIVEVDWYDAENEGLKSREEIREEYDFYDRNEFDDSRFRRRTK